MPRTRIVSLSDLERLTGSEVGTSGWITVSQEMIERFAQTTGDRQWIHVDVERAARESPYRTTVAHGFLTLALLPQMLAQAVEIGGARIGINYGLNRVRFTAPVPAGSRLRGRFRLLAVESIDGGVQTRWEVTVERQGEERPVLIAEWLTRRYG